MLSVSILTCNIPVCTWFSLAASALSLSAKDYDKIKLFEKTLENLDLVSNFIVLSFNNKVLNNQAP